MDATSAAKVLAARRSVATTVERASVPNAWINKAGVVLEASCRSGECSLCRTKLLSGKVFQPQGVKIRKSDRIYGYIHPCTAYPLEDLEIRI